VIAFRSRHTKEALFEDRVLAVPESQGKAKIEVAIGDAADAVLTPAIGP
jgi:hypothetical protein